MDPVKQGAAAGGAASPAVRPARREDLGPLAASLASAFSADPVFAWMLPGGRSDARTERIERMFRTTMVDASLDAGGIELVADRDTGGIAGGTIWLPPGAWPPPILSQLADLPRYLLILRRRFGASAALMQSIARVHPPEPHWYLATIGVVPERQGAGVAAALLRAGLARCDAAGVPAYLEASAPANVPLYEHFGFAPRPLPALPDGAPPVTPMWREPIAA